MKAARYSGHGGPEVIRYEDVADPEIAPADVIVKVSQLVSDFPEIVELDLNPVFATKKDAIAADVRIVVDFDYKPRPKPRPTEEIVKAMNGVAVLAHPSRKAAWERFQPHWAATLLGIELWNRKYDGWAPSKTAPALLRTGKQVPFAGLDFHTYRQYFPLRMALEIDPDITEASVLTSLRSRRCHALDFGRPLTNCISATSLSILRVAEEARRMAAVLIRSLKVSGARLTGSRQ